MKNTTATTFTGIDGWFTLLCRGGSITKIFGKKLWKKLYLNLFGATVNETK